MHTQDNTKNPATEKTRELEEVLHYNQNILDRLAGFGERLSQLKARLSGVSPTIEAEGRVAASFDASDIPGGVMGQLQSTHQASSARCDAIAEWLDVIEQVV